MLNSEQLLAHIRERFMDNTFNVQCCARELNLSESNLRELVNLNFNTCTHHLIETIRLEAAIKIICEDTVTIYSVCSSTGYSNQKTFRQAFKRHFNMSPHELREKIYKSENKHKYCEEIIKELWSSFNTNKDFYRWFLPLITTVDFYRLFLPLILGLDKMLRIYYNKV